MAIRGSLKEASLPDVIQLLALGQKTGCLSVTDRSSFGYIYFDKGRIIFASILNRPDRLGELLVKHDVITRQELAAAMEQQAQQPGKRLGRILIERGHLTQSQLQRHISMQIEEAVYHLFTWSQGTFYFEADELPEQQDFLVSINAENLLLEGARRVDEWTLIEKKISSFDLIFALERDPTADPDVELTDEQRTLLPLLDGQHTVQDILDETGMVEFEVGRAIYGLLQAGFATRVGRRKAEPVGPLKDARVSEHMNLARAFYQTGMYEDAQRELRAVEEIMPDSAEPRFYFGLIALRQGRYGDALRYFRASVELGRAEYAAFLNMAVALERLGRYDDALLALSQAEALRPGDPPALLTRAILQLKSGDVAAADASFASYRESLGDEPPPALYYAYAVLGAALAGDLSRAASLGEAGLRQYAVHGALLVNLGAVYERAGDLAKAESLYRRARDEAPTLPQAFKNLGDAYYRRANYEEAKEAYERALEQDANLGDDIYLKLGNIWYKEMNREKAVELWRRAFDLNPQNPVVRTNLDLVESLTSG
ncbi:MAG: tetratricopeptide repeat protein [Gemmatimonadetes bacterium]|nr:tetratricopeptide repeat protein [Gemmatimonadota bacterium]